MTAPVIFVGGAPGTGKSTIAAEVGRLFPGVRCLTAGQLIRQRLGGTGRYVRPPVEDESRAAFFQDLLVTEFARIRKREVMVAWLLDGHYAVPTPDGPAPVAPEVFERLGVTHLALAVQPLDTIQARLRARGGAAWWDGGTASLRALVHADEAQACTVAAHTGIALWRWQRADVAVAGLHEALGAPR